MMAFKLSPNLKLVLDLAPLGAFFVLYRLGGVYLATLGLMVVTAISVGLLYLSERKLALAPLMTGGVVMVMGGLSIALHDEQFIKMKPTIVNGLFAAVLLGGLVLRKQGLLKHVLAVAFQLTDEGWRILSRRWGFFFLFLAGLNELIWRNFSTDFWVSFKVFGMLGLTVLFTFAQFRLVMRYAPPAESAPESTPPSP